MSGHAEPLRTLRLANVSDDSRDPKPSAHKRFCEQGLLELCPPYAMLAVLWCEHQDVLDSYETDAARCSANAIYRDIIQFWHQAWRVKLWWNNGSLDLLTISTHNQNMSGSHWYRQIPAWLVVLLLALTTRVAVAVWLPDRVIWADGDKYEAVALSLYEGYGFGSLVINAYSVPTQALLYAGVFEVFGHSYLALRITFAALGALSCVAGYLLARRLFGNTSGWIAGVLLALYPPLVYLSALFEYPQAFFILLMGTFFVLFHRYLHSRATRDLVLAGVLLGIAVLSVPTIQLYVPIALVCVWWRKGALQWRAAAVFAAAVCVTLVPWVMRNYFAYHRFILVNESSGVNLWLANNDAYYKYGKLVAVDCNSVPNTTRYCAESRDLSDRMAKANRPDQPDLEVALIFERERIAKQRAWEYITESPGRFLTLCIRRFFEFWSPIPETVTNAGQVAGGTRNLIAIATYVPMMLLALASLILTARRWRELLPLYGYMLVFVAVYSVFLPTLRYRLPLDFVLLILAAAALHHLFIRFSCNRLASH
jgi:hypothetical protein